MNYLIPSWYRDDANLESDRLLNISKLFTENDKEHQLIIIGYLPFLRYLANRYTLAYNRLVRVYDLVQNIRITEGHPLGIDDLGLPESIERIYTPYRVLLNYSGEKYGEIRYNDFGWVSQVTYYLKEETLIDIYDDRGFVSSRSHTSLNGEKQRQEYFNEFGLHTLTEYFGDNARVVIEPAGNKNLSQKVYASLSDIISESLDSLLNSVDAGDSSLIAATDQHILSITKSIRQAKRIIRIISDDNDISQFGETDWKDIIDFSRCVITDTTKRQYEIGDELSAAKGQLPVFLIPMFNIELNLGYSNSVPEQIIYWRLSNDASSVVKAHQELMEKVIKNKDYGLIMSSDDKGLVGRFQERQQQIVDGYFNVDSESEDYKTVAHYVEAKKNKHLFNTDTEALQKVRKTNPNYKAIRAAVDVCERLDTREHPTLNEIKKDFRTARLYVEFGDTENLLLQSLALSAGVPMIVKNPTDYVKDKENGIFIEDDSELGKAISFFLKGLNNWNKSLVSSVELIEKNSSETILKKWKEVFDGA